MKFNKWSRFFTLLTALWCIVVFATGCATAWTGEAINIITLLGPAITSALAILAAFGGGVSPAALKAIQSWSTQAVSGLQEVKDLIDQYSAADTTAKPGLLTEIQTALKVIVDNLTAILPTIHVDNPQTQAKILAVIEAVQAELVALVNVVPALQGNVTSHNELKAIMAQLKTPQEFKNDFNAKVAEFGKEYEI